MGGDTAPRTLSARRNDPRTFECAPCGQINSKVNKFDRWESVFRGVVVSRAQKISSARGYFSAHIIKAHNGESEVAGYKGGCENKTSTTNLGWLFGKWENTKCG